MMLKKHFITLACLTALFPIEAALGQVSRSDIVGWLTSGNGGSWGNWTNVQYCPEGSWASRFSQRVESPQGAADDTALNAITLYCANRNGDQVATLTPHSGYWGSWASNGCSKGAHLTEFRLKVEGSQGSSGDDTSANAINFRCNNTGSTVEYAASNSGAWGSWGSWRTYSNAAICGLRERIESPQGTGDDTALNDVEFIWCRR
jgi:hypothetical protein